MRVALLIPLAASLLAVSAFAAEAEPDPLAPVVPEKSDKPKAKKAEAKPAVKKAAPKAAPAAAEAKAEPAAEPAKPVAKKAAPKADPDGEEAAPAPKKAAPRADPDEEEAAPAPKKASPRADPDEEEAAPAPKKAAAKVDPDAEQAKPEPTKAEPVKAEPAKPAVAVKPTPPPKPGKPPPPAPVLVHLVPYADPALVGPGCDEACVKSTANKLRGRAGVKKATAEGMVVVLEIQPGVFKPGAVMATLDGMKLEMRPPYKSVELHFLADGPFPPVSHLEGDVLIIDIADAARKAIEAGTKARIPTKLKCMGKLAGNDVYEAILTRYEEEKRPPVTMIPFMAEADMDGDKKPDLYLRLEGVGELVIFMGKDGELKASVVKEGLPDMMPRCDVTPSRFVRAVPKQKVKCMDGTSHAGDAIERVVLNKSNELLVYGGGKFATCEPLGEGAMPYVPRPVGKAKAKSDEKKKAEDEW